MKKTKQFPQYVDKTFGFDVVISNAPMKFIRDEWVLALNANTLTNAVMISLVSTYPFAGNSNQKHSAVARVVIGKVR